MAIQQLMMSYKRSAINMVTNGDFAAGGTNWSATSSPEITYTGGKANCQAAALILRYDPAVVLTNGVSYQVTYTISNWVGGQVEAQFTFNNGAPAVTGTARTGNGTYTETMVANGNNLLRFIMSLTATNLSLDDISLTQV